MINQTPGNPEPDPQQDQLVSDLKSVSVTLIDQFVDVHNVQDSQKRRLNPISIFQWIASRFDSGEISTASLCETTGIEYSRCEAVAGLLREPRNLPTFVSLFPSLILGEGTPLHEILSVHYIVLIRWADGKAFPIIRALHRDASGMIFEAGVYSTGMTATPLMLQQAMVQGIDNLYDNGAENIGSQSDLDELDKLVDAAGCDEDLKVRLKRLTGFFKHIMVDRIPVEAARESGPQGAGPAS